MLWLLLTSIETQFFQKKVTPSYYFEYLSLKRAQVVYVCFGKGRVLAKIFLVTLRFCALLYLKVIEQWFFGH